MNCSSFSKIVKIYAPKSDSNGPAFSAGVVDSRAGSSSSATASSFAFAAISLKRLTTLGERNYAEGVDLPSGYLNKMSAPSTNQMA